MNKRIKDKDANNQQLMSQPEQRMKRVMEGLEIALECAEAGSSVSSIALYIDDPIFGEFVKREREAELMLQVENDIIQALTFNRFRQNNPDKLGAPSADLDYNKTEY